MRPALVVLLLVPCVGAQELADDPAPPPPLWEELLRIQARLEALEREKAQRDLEPAASIDLSGEELRSLEPSRDHVLSRPWFENVELSGYASFAYLDSGGTGTTPDGSFVVKEASLFVDARVWEDAFLFTEVWLARYQYGNGFSLGETYLQLTDLLASDGRGALALKVGRFEIPFGEEYLRWDANETPLVSFSAADPYGIDEGVELYGTLGGLGWVAAVTNGANGSGADDGAAKQWCAKLYGTPQRDLYVSGSLLGTSGAESALRLGGSSLTPVGADGVSSAGASPSDDVDSLCWEVDARIAAERVVHLNLQLGQARIDDDASAFDRDLTWFLIEPGVRLRDDLELVLRWSEIGTFDDDEGYRFEGKIFADAEAFGYDTRALRRLSAGLRWTVHPRLAIKLEAGRDHLDLIDASALDPDNDERLYFAAEIVASF